MTNVEKIMGSRHLGKSLSNHYPIINLTEQRLHTTMYTDLKVLTRGSLNKQILTEATETTATQNQKQQ